MVKRVAYGLARILHELPDGWAKLGEAALRIARRCIAVAMDQAGSSMMTVQVRSGTGKRKVSSEVSGQFISNRLAIVAISGAGAVTQTICGLEYGHGY